MKWNKQKNSNPVKLKLELLTLTGDILLGIEKPDSLQIYSLLID